MPEPPITTFDRRLRTAMGALGPVCALVEISVARARRAAESGDDELAAVVARDQRSIGEMCADVKRDTVRLAWHATRLVDLRGVGATVRLADLMQRLGWSVVRMTEVGLDVADAADPEVTVWFCDLNRSAAAVTAALHHLLLRSDRPASDRFDAAADDLRLLLGEPVAGPADTAERAVAVHAELLRTAEFAAARVRRWAPAPVESPHLRVDDGDARR